jgi:hypothetical protein
MSGRGWRDHAPIGLALAALAVAVLGLTPAGQAASSLIAQVSVAQDTSAVNGIRASRTPRPNRLLPLGADARFPEAVVPRLSGARGPQGGAGEAGPAGAAGHDGGKAVIVQRDDPLELPHDGAGATVLRIDDVDAGAFVLTADVELSSVQSHSSPVRCALVRDGAELGHGVASVGTGPGGARLATLSLVGVLDAANRATIVLRCAASETATLVDVESAQASALAVADVSEFEVTG